MGSLVCCTKKYFYRPSLHRSGRKEVSKALLMQLLAPQLRLMALKALQQMPCWDNEVGGKWWVAGWRVCFRNGGWLIL